MSHCNSKSARILISAHNKLIKRSKIPKLSIDWLLQALQQEAEKLLQVMQKTAVVPADREAVKKHGEDFQEVCKKLGLPCT